MQRRTRTLVAAGSLIATLTLSWIGSPSASAQGSLMQQRVAEIRASLAKNEQMIGQYTWQQQEAISVRGDLKKEALYSVQLGANGQPVRTDISQSQPASGRKWGIRHRITQDYIDYGKQVAATISVNYADATNHVATINIDGQSKSVTIVETNVNYQKR